MKKELIAVAAVAGFFVISAVHPTREADTVLEALKSPDSNVRLEARFRIRRERRTIIKGLMQIAGSQDAGEDEQAEERRYHSSKHLAIVLLGELRTEEAVRVLWKNLTYRVKVLFGGIGETHGIGSRYPAAGSLAKIGKPASEYVASRLVVTEDALRQEIAAWILKEVEGRDLAGQIIETWLKARPGEQANLKAVLEYLDEE